MRLHGHLPGRLVHFDVGDGRDSRHWPAASARRLGLWRCCRSTPAPATGVFAIGFVGRGFETFGAALVGGQVAQAKLHGIDFQVGGDLVDQSIRWRSSARDRRERANCWCAAVSVRENAS